MHPTRILLIRHGHTSSNGGGPTILSGWTDLPLSELGKQQIRHLAERLRGGRPFDAIYSSPSRRALDTADALVAAGLGVRCPVPDLREIHCGDVEGMLVEDVRRRWPALWAQNERQDDDEFRWPGGESYREFRLRALAAIALLGALHRGGRIAVVTHAGVISQILGTIHGSPPARWEPFRPENAGTVEVIWMAGQNSLADGHGRWVEAPVRCVSSNEHRRVG